MWTDYEVIFHKMRQQSHYAQENQNQIFHDFHEPSLLSKISKPGI